jgi:hypothetical protein
VGYNEIMDSGKGDKLNKRTLLICMAICVKCCAAVGKVAAVVATAGGKVTWVSYDFSLVHLQRENKVKSPPG